MLPFEELLEVMAHPWLQYVQRFLLNMATINLSLAVFNFLPIPPLDGYHIFNDLLFRGEGFSFQARRSAWRRWFCCCCAFRVCFPSCYIS